MAAGRNVAQRDRSQLLNLVDDGTVTGPGGAKFAVANYPIVSSD